MLDAGTIFILELLRINSLFFHWLLTSNRSVTIIKLPNGYFIEGDNYGSVKNVGVEDTPRISEPLSFFEKTLFSSAPTGVSHR